MTKTRAYAASSPTSPLAPFEIHRREPLATDVEIEVLHCGICHTDIHQVRDEWHGSIFPIVPGHEIVGRVTRVGDAVKNFRPGDLAGVGCMVGSCRACEACKEGEEQFCASGAVWTYNSPDPHGGLATYGGYSERIVADEAFVLKVPANLDEAAAAPLLCAGITTYSPLRRWGVGPGQTVGVVGLGGLGHMGEKLAKAMGAEVVVFTHSQGKAQDALRLGADEVALSRDTAALGKLAGRFHFILDTVSAPHDMNAYLGLLRRNGALVQVGAPPEPQPISAFSFIFGRKSLSGSLIGGIRETQEMLDFCGAHGIVSDIETIPIQKVNEAYERMLRSDVKYRFVIDMASLRR